MVYFKAVYSIKDQLDVNETSYKICLLKKLPQHIEAVRALVPVSGKSYTFDFLLVFKFHWFN